MLTCPTGCCGGWTPVVTIGTPAQQHIVDLPETIEANHVHVQQFLQVG